MKKLFVLLLTAMLLMSCAYAGSLEDLLNQPAGGSLDDLIEAPSGLLPDPCLANSKDPTFVGELYRENFTLGTDYVCDAYLYPRVSNSFVSSYTRVLQKFGYTMTETTVDGRDGYSIQCGDGLEALMITDFNGKMLFLVEKGMDFVLTNVCTVTYNGADYHMYLYLQTTPSSYPYDSWGGTYKVENAYFERLALDFPKDVRSGSFYDVPAEAACYDGLKMDYYRNYNFKTLLYDNVTLYRTDAIDSSRDFATFSISRVEDTEYGRLIVGTFEARFSSGDDEFENGSFSMMISD